MQWTIPLSYGTFLNLGTVLFTIKRKGCPVKISGYVVWVNDTSFWHRTEQGAQKRVFKAELKGQDVFIHALHHEPDYHRPVGPKGRRAV